MISWVSFLNKIEDYECTFCISVLLGNFFHYIKVLGLIKAVIELLHIKVSIFQLQNLMLKQDTIVCMYLLKVFGKLQPIHDWIFNAHKLAYLHPRKQVVRIRSLLG